MEMIKKYILVAIAFFAALLLKLFAFDIYQVNGDSMSPFLKSGDIILVEKLSYKFAKPKNGDVVVIKNDELIIKRIAAEENDTIRFLDNNLYINDELKIMDIPSEGIKEELIPREYYYVLGDNRSLSLDSRSFGPVHKSNICGRYLVKINP